MSTPKTGLKALLQIVLQKNPSICKSELFDKNMKKYMIVPKTKQLLPTIQDIHKITLVLTTENIPLFTWIFHQLVEFPAIYLTGNFSFYFFFQYLEKG